MIPSTSTWMLILILTSGEAVELNSSRQGCAAYVQDLMTGYVPRAQDSRGQWLDVVTAVCADRVAVDEAKKRRAHQGGERTPRVVAGPATFRTPPHAPLK